MSCISEENLLRKAIQHADVGSGPEDNSAANLRFVE